ncbi:MAG TPA: hypothetical protein VNO24_27795 [Blastocatellia bacterium]|nr:hypothetical protein [Blastocatellia bacterium]
MVSSFSANSNPERITPPQFPQGALLAAWRDRIGVFFIRIQLGLFKWDAAFPQLHFGEFNRFSAIVGVFDFDYSQELPI